MKRDARTRRLLDAVLSGVGGRAVGLLAPLLATPAMLHYFGDAGFGVWATGISITGIAAFSDLGIGNGVMTRIADAFGRNDRNEIQKIVTAAYISLLIISLLLATGTMWISYYYDALDLMHFEIILSVIGSYIIGIPFSVIHQILYGLQKIPASNLFTALGALGSLASCLIAIHLQLPLWLVAASYSICPLFAALAAAVWLFGRDNELRPRISSFNIDFSIDLLKIGSQFFLLSIIMAISMNIDNLIISVKAGPAAVAGYSVLSRLGVLLTLLTTALFVPLWPANGEALSRSDYSWVRRNTRNMSIMGAVLVGLCGLGLAFWSKTILNMWVNRTFPDQEIILIMMVLFSIVVAATSPFNMILNALGRADLQILPWTLFLISSVILKFVLVDQSNIWLMPAISGVLYVTLISPLIIKSALKFVSVQL